MDGIEGAIAAFDALRRKAAVAAQPQPAIAPAPPPVQPATVPRTSTPQVPAPAQYKAGQPLMESRPKAGPLQSMFEDGNSLLRAIVASEILGPPVALRLTETGLLREHDLWIQPPNEPST